jgi:hypothetical protein
MAASLQNYLDDVMQVRDVGAQSPALAVGELCGTTRHTGQLRVQVLEQHLVILEIGATH